MLQDIIRVRGPSNALETFVRWFISTRLLTSIDHEKLPVAHHFHSSPRRHGVSDEWCRGRRWQRHRLFKRVQKHLQQTEEVSSTLFILKIWHLSILIVYSGPRKVYLHEYCDSFLHRRFLRRPNVSEASDQFSRLAKRLESQEEPQYAAACYLAVAKCEQSIGEVGEVEAYVAAARAFFKAETDITSINCNSLQLHLTDGKVNDRWDVLSMAKKHIINPKVWTVGPTRFFTLPVNFSYQ